MVYRGTGRRKTSVAQVRLVEGNGQFTINNRPIDEYLDYEVLRNEVRKPLEITGNAGKFDVICKVEGGGFTGQAGAIRHALSRALLVVDAANRPALKTAGYLKRDPRMKERKKYGLKAARRSPQFSKR